MCLQKLCSDSSNELTLSELGDHKELCAELSSMYLILNVSQIKTHSTARGFILL